VGAGKIAFNDIAGKQDKRQVCAVLPVSGNSYAFAFSHMLFFRICANWQTTPVASKRIFYTF